MAQTANRTVLKTHKGKHEVVFTEGNHRYKVDGEYKQGVTSLIGTLSKDALVQWSANMAVKYIEDNCSVSKVVTENGYNSEIASVLAANAQYVVSDADLAKAKKNHVTFRDSAADVGKQVHKWIELHLKGQDTVITDAMRPSVSSYLNWEAKYKPETFFSERVLYSERLDMCGTSDHGCNLSTKRTVLDFKTGKPDEEYNVYRHQSTGKKRAYTTAFLQGAFYDIALEEEDGAFADQYAVLYLPVTGGYWFYRTDRTAQLRECATALRTFNKLWTQENFNNKYEEE